MTDELQSKEPLEHPEPVSPPSWQEELAKLDPQEFRKIINQHPGLSGVIGGIIGVERQRAVQNYESLRQGEGEINRLAEMDTELLKLLEDNEEHIKTHYPKAYEKIGQIQQNRIAKEMTDVQGKTTRQIGLAIGRALADVPEWSRVPNERKQELASLIQGKSDEDALSVFNHHAWQMVADVRAEEQIKKYRETEQGKDRESLRQEEAAKLMKNTTAPDLKKPSGPPVSVNLRDMTPSEFDRYWEDIKSKHNR